MLGMLSLRSASAFVGPVRRRLPATRVSPLVAARGRFGTVRFASGDAVSDGTVLGNVIKTMPSGEVVIQARDEAQVMHSLPSPSR